MKQLLLFLLFSSSTVWGFDHTHETFREVLSAHVIRNGKQTLVNYNGLKKNPAKLDVYIASLGSVTKSDYETWTTEQKLATLINGYNAWTLKLITNHYPVKSIRKIGPFYTTPWKENFIKWLDEKVSLDHIEHNVIRKEFKEPRIHFALVCAAVSCPSLQEKPFTAVTLEAQLEKALDEFLQDGNKNYVEIKEDKVTLHLSSIFDWYGSDFGDSEKLRNYLLAEYGLTEKAKGKNISIKYLDYDWKLNDLK